MSATSTTVAIVLASALCLGGCGHQSSTASPTGPSPAAPAAPPSSGISGTATISGTVAASSGGAAIAWAPRSVPAGLTLTVSGTNLTASVDSSGHFVLTNVPPGTVALRFTGAGIDATLSLSDVATNDQVQLTVEVSGSSATVDDEEHVGHDNRSELEGTISAIDLVAGTLTVNQTLVTVPAGTPIRHGGTTLAFIDLVVGERVHVKGTRQGSGVVASEVDVQNLQAVPPPQNESEVHGTVSGLIGTCPALTFVVGSTTVVTTAGTEFKGMACSALANGASVQVQGTKAATGIVTATRVQSKGKD